MKKAWVVAVDMGYGHQRAAFALKDIAKDGGVISANNYTGIPKLDHTIWDDTRKFYEFVSKFKKVPLVGRYLFGLLDKVQEIKPLYPKTRPLMPPSLQLRAAYKLMEKKEWGRHLIEKLNQDPLPFIATFPIPAFMAEYWGYKGPIYLLVTDSDAARTWAPIQPRKTKIRYFAPSTVVAERLVQYGIPKKNITYTGFPLPEPLTSAGVLKKSIKRRLTRLDPERVYLSKYDDLVKEYIGSMPPRKDGIPLLTFAIGGAGAQQHLGEQIIESLSHSIKQGHLRLCMAAGTHMDAVSRFKEVVQKHNLTDKEVEVMACVDKDEYFEEFNDVLQRTDILWTKPSEVSFYAALGIPLILSPPIGAQEVRNRSWLLQLGSAVDQLDPQYAAEWIMDLINQGILAEAAMQGFVEMERAGTANIKKIISQGA